MDKTVYNWLPISLPWRASSSSPEIQELHSELSAVSRRLQVEWLSLEPELGKFLAEAPNNFPNGDRVSELNRLYPWGGPVPRADAAGIDSWLAETLQRMDEVFDTDRETMEALIRYRHAGAIQSLYIYAHPHYLQVARKITTMKAHCFSTHPACKVGTLIEVLRADTGATDRLLIGDVRPDGADDGCCTHSIADNDIVKRYCDLTEMITQANQAGDEGQG